jgi:tetratricopeptide (TPR) repeat protein
MANVTLAREYWDKAFKYYFDGESDRAIAAGRKAMELNPRLARPHWIIGQAFLFREVPDRESAIKEFRQLVLKDPRWCEGHAALGSSLEKLGRIDEAVRSVFADDSTRMGEWEELMSRYEFMAETLE